MINSILKVKGFQLFRSDRLGHAGGVALFIRDGIKCKEICKSDPNNAIEYFVY